MAINFHIAQSFRLLRYQDAEKNRQRRSRIVQTLNGDPAASPLGGAHRLGAPYSSHRAPQRVRLGPSLATALLGTRCVLARRGWAGEKDELFEHPAGVFSCWAIRATARIPRVPKQFFRTC